MRLVVSSADEGAGIGVTRATGFGSGSARSNIWPRIMARFVDGSGAAGAQMATWARLSRQRPKGGRTIRLPTTSDADPAEGRPAGAPAGRTSPFSNRDEQLLHRRVVHLGDVFPIHQMIRERLEIVRPPIAIIDVVGMFPYVAAEDRLATVHQWVLAVGGLSDDDLAVLDGEPGPA